MRVDFLKIETTGADGGEAVRTESVVATVRWDGTPTLISAADDAIGSQVMALFNPTPLVTDEPSLRNFGASGVEVVSPGSYEWFREAARTRAPSLGLAIRFVADMEPGEGFDPAEPYSTLRAVVARLQVTG